MRDRDSFFAEFNRYPTTRELNPMVGYTGSEVKSLRFNGSLDAAGFAEVAGTLAGVTGKTAEEVIAGIRNAQREQNDYDRLVAFRKWLLSLDSDYEARGKINLGKIIDKAKETLDGYQRTQADDDEGGMDAHPSTSPPGTHRIEGSPTGRLFRDNPPPH
jgi:hypothetical protein